MPYYFVPNRFDSFSERLAHYPISNEQHVIPSAAPYWVRLCEVPYQDDPTAISIPGFRETVTSPTSGYYRVDYIYNTGLIEFHADNAGQSVNVTYRGVGSILHADQLGQQINAAWPYDVYPRGCAEEWVGTHFNWVTTFAPPYMDIELVKQYLTVTDNHLAIINETDVNKRSSGWAMNLVDYRTSLSMVFSASAAYITKTDTPNYTTPAIIAIANRYVTYGVTNEFGQDAMALQVGFTCLGSFGQHVGIYAAWAYTFVYSPTNQQHIAVMTIDKTQVTTTSAESKVLLLEFPSWRTLPVGFGITGAGTAYFCTFCRSLWMQDENWVYDEPSFGTPDTPHYPWYTTIGVLNKDANDYVEIDSTKVEHKGGYVTILTSYFTSPTQPYDVRIELVGGSARCFINGQLAAVHNTWTPDPYYTGMIPLVAVSSREAKIGRPGTGYKIDYFCAGRIKPIGG